MSDNPIHDAERGEWRRALRWMTEAERYTACGHTVRIHGICIDCNDIDD